MRVIRRLRDQHSVGTLRVFDKVMHAHIYHDLRTRHNLDIELFLELMEHLRQRNGELGSAMRYRYQNDLNADKMEKTYLFIITHLHLYGFSSQEARLRDDCCQRLGKERDKAVKREVLRTVTQER